MNVQAPVTKPFIPPTGEEERTFIVQVEYCGTCAGSCATCVLTPEERASDRPLTTVARVEAALAGIAAAHAERPALLALGLGRGNNLVLGPSAIDEHIALARAAERHLDPEGGVVEISTSLVGKIEPQIDRARATIDAFDAAGLSLSARFVVVANTALASAPYWRNLDRFIEAIQDHRGGIYFEGNGDIMSLNLGIPSLPDPGWMARKLAPYMFPVNLAWVPSLDPGAASEEGLARLGEWLVAFSDAAEAAELDTNILHRSMRAVIDGQAALPALTAHVERSRQSVIYIDPEGQWRPGFYAILAEIDFPRFDPLGGGELATAGPAEALRRLMRNPACRGCPMMGPCVASGAFMLGLLALRHHPNGTRVCPSAMRGVFERASHDRAA